MMAPEPSDRPWGADPPRIYLGNYERFGYAIVRGVFNADEVAELGAAFDRIYTQGLQHPKSFRHGNSLFRLSNDPKLGRIVRFMQWPSYFDPVLDRFRRDMRMLAIIRPLIGDDVKQIINQMHWKPPGAERVEFGFHQDIRFRRPREAYRDPATSYVQTGIAVDRHSAENGAMIVYPGSHRLGELAAGPGRVMDQALSVADLEGLGLDPRQAVSLDLEPGDVALWNLFTLHGSGPNRSPGDRRFYINGYVRAASCDRGEWTFRNGASVPLGEPTLVHYEDLYRRPEPHYVDD